MKASYVALPMYVHTGWV